MRNLLTLTLPGPSGGIQIDSPVKTGPNNFITSPDLGGLLSGLLNVAIYAGAFLMFFWMAWGVFQYIFAGGDKGVLDQAKKRITFAIIGFFIILLAYSAVGFLQTIIKPQNVDVRSLSP